MEEERIKETLTSLTEGHQAQRKVKRVKRKLSDTVTYEDLVKDWTQCCYLIPHKMKLCNMQRNQGSRYCGAHLVHDTNEEIKSKLETRVPCPLDPSHTVYERDLQRHLKVCNAKKYQQEIEQLPCYRENCNSGPRSAEVVSGESSNDKDFVERLLKKIDAMWSDVVLQPLPAKNREGGDDLVWVEERIRAVLGRSLTDDKDRSSFKHWKHIEQDIAIVKQLLRYSLLTAHSDSESSESQSSEEEEGGKVFIEYGAGKGLLGMSINLLDRTSSLLFVERSGNRKKIDKILAERNCRFQRFRLDIRHCYVPSLPFVADVIASSETEKEGKKSRQHSVTIVAKHLCGVATDMAILSLRHVTPSASLHCGVAIATCCHHACQYDDYVGREMWLDRFGVTREEFDVAKYWSAWATLDLAQAHLRKRKRGEGEGEKEGEVVEDKKKKTSEEKEEEDDVEEEGEPSQHTSVLTDAKVKEVQSRYRDVIEARLTYEEMRDYGRKIKRVLDFGRLLYLKEVLRLRTTAVQQYCEESYSPEAFLLLGSSR